MKVTLHVWRQPGPDAPGTMVKYDATEISPDMSFLEMLDEPLVDDVEHLEKRHVGADLGRVVLDHRARCVGAGLSPNMEGDLHL